MLSTVGKDILVKIFVPSQGRVVCLSYVAGVDNSPIDPMDRGERDLAFVTFFYFFIFFIFLYHIFVVRYKKSHGALAMAKIKPKIQNELTKETSGTLLFSWGPYRSQAHIRARN